MHGTHPVKYDQKGSPPQPPYRQLLELIQEESKLPTLGVAIAKVVEITSSDEDSAAELARFILSDVALTQKILLLSNTIAYRTMSGASVTTISRAIFLLGFETIKASALASLLVDGFRDRVQAQAVRVELLKALCASASARELTKHGRHRNVEEAAVVALFKNIGRTLIAAFDHALYERIQAEQRASTEASGTVCMRLLGCSYDRFGEMLLKSWNMPAAIIDALQSTPTQKHRSEVRADWIREAACFGADVAELLVLPAGDPAAIAEQRRALAGRYGAALDVDAEQLAELLDHVDREAREVAESLDVTLFPGVVTVAADPGLLQDLSLPDVAAEPLRALERFPSGKPINASELLLAGVQDATQMLSSTTPRINELMLLVQETLYTALGFRFVTVCLRDPKQGRYVARLAVGEKHAERSRHFQFPLNAEGSIFDLALSNNADMMIVDALSPKIQAALPAWHKALLPDTRSFIVLPLTIDRKPIGLLYADRAAPSPEGMTREEIALMKTLKGQLLAAMVKR